MPLFEYHAIDQVGKKRVGRLSAESNRQLSLHLESLGLMMLKAKEVQEGKTARQYKGTVPEKELINFTHHLIMVFTSGVPLLTGIRDIANETTHEGMKRVLSDFVVRLEAGQTLTEVFSAYPRVFDDTYIRLLEAGEESGRIDDVLTRLVEHMEWKAETRGTVTQALIYPAVLVCAVIGLILILMTFLLPRIGHVFERINVELPKPTQFLLGISDFVVGEWALLLCGFAFMVISFIVIRRIPSGRIMFDRGFLCLPILGPLVRKAEAAHFCHTLATLYEAGVALPRALHIVAHSLKNRFLAVTVAQTSTEVTEGKQISESLRQSNVFQPLVVRMISVGEETGSLGESLARVNKFFDREVPQAVKKMVALLEPMIIIVSGAIVAFIILCTLLPIFRLFSALRGG